MADDPSIGDKTPSDATPPPVPGGQPPVAAGGGGSPTGNLPPSSVPGAQMVAALGAKARGQELVKAGSQLMSLALPLLGIQSPEGQSLMRILHTVSKHFSIDQEQKGGGDQSQALMKLLAAQGQQGPVPGGPAAPPPGAGGPQVPRGPIPSMAGGMQ